MPESDASPHTDKPLPPETSVALSSDKITYLPASNQQYPRGPAPPVMVHEDPRQVRKGLKIDGEAV
jgi:hypothetical protein